MTRYVLASVIAAFTLLPLSAQPATVQSSTPSAFPTRSGVIVVKIASGRSVYKLGAIIKLRVVLINKGGQELVIPMAPPYGLTNLNVFDGRGGRLPATGERGVVCCGWRRSITLPPGKAVTIQFSDPDSHWVLSEWADIRRWGYEIKQPGTYTITASPYLTAIGRNVGQFNTSLADKSNVLRIVITR